MEHTWKIQAFEALSLHELYEILKWRCDIFVVEQTCYYSDVDDLDQQAIHLTLLEGDALLGYCRVLPPGTYAENPSIGRVLIVPEKRGTGLGRILMEKAMAFCKENYTGTPIVITAQCVQEKFYTSLGFQTTSTPFDWAGIDHIEMKYTGTRTN